LLAALLVFNELPLAVISDGKRHLCQRLAHLTQPQHREMVNRLATTSQLSDANLTAAGLKITPLNAAVPDAV
jgi:hypothetical protein